MKKVQVLSIAAAIGAVAIVGCGASMAQGTATVGRVGPSEAAYATMWTQYQRGEPPAGFAVAPA